MKEESEIPYRKAYYQKNREKCLAYQKEYQRNRELLTPYQKEYYQKNRLKLISCQKKYSLKNKEKIKERNVMNKEKNAAYQKEYRLKNKEKQDAYQKEYNRKKKLNGSIQVKVYKEKKKIIPVDGNKIKSVVPIKDEIKIASLTQMIPEETTSTFKPSKLYASIMAELRATDKEFKPQFKTEAEKRKASQKAYREKKLKGINT